MEYFFKGAEYLSSFTDYKSTPEDGVPIIVFIGRSNSGKSTLISSLCDHKNLARTSSTPGKTRLLNYFTVPVKNEAKDTIYFVDTPGYGYAKMSAGERKSLRNMVDGFLLNKKGVRLIVLILDARRKMGEEEKSVLMYCRESKVPIVFVRSKWDTLNQKEKSKAVKDWKTENIFNICQPVSSTQKSGLEKISSIILSLI